MVFDPAEFRPGGALARELSVVHEFGSRVGEHAGKIGVGDFGEDGDVARIFLAEDRDGFGQDIREDAELGHDVHSVEGFAFRKVGDAVEPVGASSHGGGGMVCFWRHRVFLSDKKGYDVGVHLRNYKMVYVEEFG